MTHRLAAIDAYFAGLTTEQRTALEAIRRAVHDAVPDVEECISYGMPAFRVNGTLIAGFKANAKHCSYHPMSGATVATLQRELAGYETSKGTIRFPAQPGLTAVLVRQLVAARLAEPDA